MHHLRSGGAPVPVWHPPTHLVSTHLSDFTSHDTALTTQLSEPVPVPVLQGITITIPVLTPHRMPLHPPSSHLNLAPQTRYSPPQPSSVQSPEIVPELANFCFATGMPLPAVTVGSPAPPNRWQPDHSAIQPNVKSGPASQRSRAPPAFRALT